MLWVLDSIIMFFVDRFMVLKSNLRVVVEVVGGGSLLVMSNVLDMSLFLCFKVIGYVIVLFDNCVDLIKYGLVLEKL